MFHKFIKLKSDRGCLPFPIFANLTREISNANFRHIKQIQVKLIAKARAHPHGVVIISSCHKFS